MDRLESHDLVRIFRIDDLEALTCRIHLSTNDCIIASELSDSLDLDGLCILPTASVRYFDRDFDEADFYRAALGAWPDADPHAELVSRLSCSMVDDLRFLASRGDIVAIHVEHDDPDVCYIGAVHDVTEETLQLDMISARGKRVSEPRTIEIGSITKLEIATRYLVAVDFGARVLAAKL